MKEVEYSTIILWIYKRCAFLCCVSYGKNIHQIKILRQANNFFSHLCHFKITLQKGTLTHFISVVFCGQVPCAFFPLPFGALKFWTSLWFYLTFFLSSTNCQLGRSDSDAILQDNSIILYYLLQINVFVWERKSGEEIVTLPYIF